MSNVSLHTSLVEFEALHEAVDRSRKGSASVKVSRDALLHLLMDHSALTKGHKEASHEVVGGEDR